MGGTVLASALSAWELAPLAAGTAAVSLSLPARRFRARRRHAAALRNIAELERELGYDVPLEQRIERELRLVPPPVPTSLRITGFCDRCNLHVVVNDGVCDFGAQHTPDDCAKRIYRATGTRKANQGDY